MKAPIEVVSDANYMDSCAVLGLDPDALWEWTHENRVKRETEGPWVGKRPRARALFQSSRATDCGICRGRGWVPVGPDRRVACLDCSGSGRVIHCVACNGRGALWLGGADYLECMECEGTGAFKPGRQVVLPKSGVIVANRNLAFEERHERSSRHDHKVSA